MNDVSDPETVASRKRFVMATHPLMRKHEAEATPCSSTETAEDYRELVKRLKSDRSELDHMIELAEEKVKTLEVA